MLVSCSSRPWYLGIAPASDILIVIDETTLQL